jgi:hypothetical protein
MREDRFPDVVMASRPLKVKIFCQKVLEHSNKNQPSLQMEYLSIADC